MPQRILSLEITDDELKAAVLQTSFRDYKVSAFYREAFNGAGPEASLKRFLAQHGEAGDTILSALPGDRVTWRTFFLPFRDAKKLAQTVPFELENNVPFGLDEVVVDYQILQRDRSGSTVLAALVQKEDLERHLELLQKGGADPKVVDIGSLATLNTLSLVSDLPPTFAFVDFAPHSTTVALYRERALMGLRTVTRSTTGAPAANGNGEHVPEPVDVASLVAETRWTLLALNGAPLDDDLVCYVAGDPVLVANVERPLAEALPAAVRRLDRTPLRNITAELGAQAPAFSSSLGLALREVSPANTVGLNFRRGEFTFHRSQQEMRRALRNVAALGLVVLVLTVVDMIVKHQQLAQQATAIETQIQMVLDNTLPDAGRVPNPKGTLQEEIDALRQRVDLLNDVVPVSSSTSIDILRAAASAVPNKVRIDCEEYAMDPDAVRIRCNTDTYDSVETIKEGLLKTGYFSDVEVKDAKAAKDGKGVDFRMSLKLNKDFRPQPGGRK
ncbi:MAG: type II secretion system protein GspL [Candidatus Binatia bacterium]